jgi:hypothetical protein
MVLSVTSWPELRHYRTGLLLPSLGRPQNNVEPAPGLDGLPARKKSETTRTNGNDGNDEDPDRGAEVPKD